MKISSSDVLFWARMKKVPAKVSSDKNSITLKTFMLMTTSMMVWIKWPYILKILKKYINLTQMKKDAIACKYR